MTEELCNVIRNQRLRSGMTQVELSEVTGLSVNYISLLECGAREPSMEALRKIAAALGCRVRVTMEERK